MRHSEEVLDHPGKNKGKKKKTILKIEVIKISVSCNIKTWHMVQPFENVKLGYFLISDESHEHQRSKPLAGIEGLLPQTVLKS